MALKASTKYSLLRNKYVDVNHLHKSDKVITDKFITDIRNRLICEDEFYHVNTRWFRLFKECDDKSQLYLIKKAIEVYQQFINRSIENKVTPIELEGLGKFVIQPGRRDFLDLCRADDFDGDYDAVVEKVKEKQQIRYANKRLQNKIKNDIDYKSTIKIICKS